MISIYQFPRKHIAERLFGSDSSTNLRRVDALLDGETKMTVDTLYALFKVEPLLDLEKSLRDLYARYEVARFRKRRVRRNRFGSKEEAPLDPC